MKAHNKIGHDGIVFVNVDDAASSTSSWCGEFGMRACGKPNARNPTQPLAENRTCRLLQGLQTDGHGMEAGASSNLTILTVSRTRLFHCSYSALPLLQAGVCHAPSLVHCH